MRAVSCWQGHIIMGLGTSEPLLRPNTPQRTPFDIELKVQIVPLWVCPPRKRGHSMLY
jgi:hypothetical protein